MAINSNDLKNHYNSLETEILEEIYAKGGLTDKAKLILDKILRSRGVSLKGIKEKIRKKEIRENNIEHLNGLSGWLILIGIILILSLIKTIPFIYTYYDAIFSSNVWSKISDYHSEGYNFLLSVAVIGSLVLNIIMFLILVYTTDLFFNKKRIFVKWFTFILVVSPFSLLANSLLINQFYPSEKLFELIESLPFLGSLFSVALWITYLNHSKRVKATFTKK